jgi:hypothetical protein
VHYEDGVAARLAGLVVPVDDDLAAAHASLMASVPAASGPGPRRRVRTMVAGGTLVGAMLAGTGIAAAAGNLPAPVQNTAHTVLAKVGVDVPRGTARSTDGCPAGQTFANHGQYVRSLPKGAARDAAAQSNCGKPLVSVNGSKDDGSSTTSTTEGADGKGKSGEDHGSSTASTAPGHATASTAPGQAKKHTPSTGAKPGS